MPPVKHENTVTTRLPDGRWHHRLRQSWVNTFLTCPELALLTSTGQVDHRETDSTAVGTAVHWAAEQATLLAMQDVWLAPEDVVELFDIEWARLQDELDIQWVKRKVGGATSYGRRCAESYGEFVLPRQTPIAVEVAFHDLVLIDDDRRLVTFSGTMDMVDAAWGACDYKTASRKYEKWEKERWSFQPTVYLWALNRPEMAHVADAIQPEARNRWRYIVFPDDPNPYPQIVDFERPAPHEWESWMIAQVESFCALMEAELSVWPRNDQHALCSPKWCEAWDQCKGASLVTPRWVQRK